MRACPEDISSLAAQCKGDVRRALLTLQFLTLSGGGWSKEPRPVVIRPSEKAADAEKKLHKGRESPAAKIGMSAARDENDSDGDFVSLKPLRKKARRIVDDDDDDSGSSAVASNSAGARAISEGKGQDSGVVVSADKLPLVHLRLFESVLGVSCVLKDLYIRCMKVRRHKGPDDLFM